MDISRFLFPNHTCLNCRGEINSSTHPLICDECVGALPRAEKVCEKCGRSVSEFATVCQTCTNIKHEFTMARSAFIYDAPICGLVLRLKYSSEADVARMFAPFVLDAYGKDFAERVDIIIPVPLTPKRQRSRGYNQALLLAKGLSKEIGIAVGEPLIRVRETVAQKEMTIAERQENLKGAFRVEDKKAVKGKNVLLIDDVLTTGTTASECAKVLKKAGAREVFVLTIATTLFN